MTVHGIVTHVDGPIRTRNPRFPRWEVSINLGHHDHVIGSNQVFATTIDPFAADTARQHVKRPVSVTIKNTAYGYNLVAIEGRS